MAAVRARAASNEELKLSVVGLAGVRLAGVLAKAGAPWLDGRSLTPVRYAHLSAQDTNLKTMSIGTEQFQAILEYGRETRGTEFKGPGRRTDKHFVARVVRAVLAMSNTRDGGRVIIGVEETSEGYVATGMTDQQLTTWHPDSLNDTLARYADPYVTCEIDTIDFNGRQFVIIHVSEFEEVPVICKKDFPGVLRDGACYVRSRRKPESVEVPSHSELRELLDLSVEKQLRRFLARAERVGIAGVGGLPSDRDRFDQQLDEDFR